MISSSVQLDAGVQDLYLHLPAVRRATTAAAVLTAMSQGTTPEQAELVASDIRESLDDLTSAALCRSPSQPQDLYLRLSAVRRATTAAAVLSAISQGATPEQAEQVASAIRESLDDLTSAVLRRSPPQPQIFDLFASDVAVDHQDAHDHADNKRIEASVDDVDTDADCFVSDDSGAPAVNVAAASKYGMEDPCLNVQNTLIHDKLKVKSFPDPESSTDNHRDDTCNRLQDDASLCEHAYGSCNSESPVAKDSSLLPCDVQLSEDDVFVDLTHGFDSFAATFDSGGASALSLSFLWQPKPFLHVLEHAGSIETIEHPVANVQGFAVEAAMQCPALLYQEPSSVTTKDQSSIPDPEPTTDNQRDAYGLCNSESPVPKDSSLLSCDVQLSEDGVDLDVAHGFESFAATFDYGGAPARSLSFLWQPKPFLQVFEHAGSMKLVDHTVANPQVFAVETAMQCPAPLYQEPSSVTPKAPSHVSDRSVTFGEASHRPRPPEHSHSPWTPWTPPPEDADDYFIDQFEEMELFMSAFEERDERIFGEHVEVDDCVTKSQSHSLEDYKVDTALATSPHQVAPEGGADFSSHEPAPQCAPSSLKYYNSQNFGSRDGHALKDLNIHDVANSVEVLADKLYLPKDYNVDTALTASSVAPAGDADSSSQSRRVTSLRPREQCNLVFRTLGQLEAYVTGFEGISLPRAHLQLEQLPPAEQAKRHIRTLCSELLWEVGPAVVAGSWASLHELSGPTMYLDGAIFAELILRVCRIKGYDPAVLGLDVTQDQC